MTSPLNDDNVSVLQAPSCPVLPFIGLCSCQPGRPEPLCVDGCLGIWHHRLLVLGVHVLEWQCPLLDVLARYLHDRLCYGALLQESGKQP